DPFDRSPEFIPICVLVARVAAYDKLAADGRLQTLSEVVSRSVDELAESAEREDGYLEESLGRVTQVVFTGPQPVQAAAALRAATALAEITRPTESPGRTIGKTAPVYGIALTAGLCARGTFGRKNRAIGISIGGACARAYRIVESAGPGEIILDDAFRRAFESSDALLPALQAVGAMYAVDEGTCFRVVRPR
ncbi:MAG TPA: hypothetical protein VFJ58_09450, partial [Armatimonadota bacterium]|nr:hypothetical protein [Armatimonadota bacterium]